MILQFIPSDKPSTPGYRSKLLAFGIITDVIPIRAQKAREKILVEGANATMPDIDYGTHPIVTSSSTEVGGAISGLALNPFGLADIVGVVKAYTARFRAGPFQSEKKNVGILDDKQRTTS